MMYRIETFCVIEENGSKKVDRWTEEDSGGRITGNYRYFIMMPIPQMIQIGPQQFAPIFQDMPLEIKASSLDEAFANFDQTIADFQEAVKAEQSKPKLVL